MVHSRRFALESFAPKKFYSKLTRESLTNHIIACYICQASVSVSTKLSTNLQLSEEWYYYITRVIMVHIA